MIRRPNRKEERIAEMNITKKGDLRVLAYRVSPDGGIPEGVLIIYMRSGRAERIVFEREDQVRIGDVYLARAKSTNPETGGAFLDIGGKKTAFMNYGGKKNIHVINREYDGTLKPCDELAVRVRDLERGDKKLRVIFASDVPATEYEHKKAPCILHIAKSAFDKSIRDVLEEESALWLTEDAGIYEKTVSVTESGDLRNGRDRIKLYSDQDISMNALYDVRAALSRITARRIHLPGGAEIVIDRTEAMTVIDVNSASGRKVHMSGDSHGSSTALAINSEAAEEIAYQIDARNIGGMILVDMLKMKDAESESILLKQMNEMLGSLNPPAHAEDITKLGIAEIVRAKCGEDIYQLKTVLDKTILA